jgi:hypothetical protein
MRKSTIAGVAALSAAIVAVPMAASAANGGAWLLGRSNAESAPTYVTNSAGTPLALRAKAGYPALSVNTGNKVVNLNADTVDGYDSTKFAMRIGKTGTIVHDGTFDGWGAKCPAGTVFVSGGGYAKFGSAIYYTGPDWDVATGKIVPNSWLVLDDSGVGVSNVTCYQPSGAAIAGVATTVEQLAGDALVAQQTAGASSFPSAAGTAKLNDFKASQGQAKR